MTNNKRELNIQEASSSDNTKRPEFSLQGKAVSTPNALVPFTLKDLKDMEGPLHQIIGEHLKAEDIDIYTIMGRARLRQYIVHDHPEVSDREAANIITNIEKCVEGTTFDQYEPNQRDISFSLFLRLVYLLDMDMEMVLIKSKK